jgi:hypothetical protein
MRTTFVITIAAFLIACEIAAVAAESGTKPDNADVESAAPGSPKQLPLPNPTAARAYGDEGTVDATKAPVWWLSQPDEVASFLRSLPGVEVFELGRSAGNRPILAAAWGQREDLPGRTSASLASAIAGGDPQAFYGQGQRQRQGFVFLGAAHGTEIEGTVAALNFLNVIATGQDLRGKAWPRMAEAGRKLRVVIVPFLNIDGRERFREFRHFIGLHPDDYRLITNGRWKDGELLGWPESKLHHPVPTERVDVLGSYYNDHGVNLVYDDAIGDACEPETRALMQFLRRERPDCVLCSHSNNGSLVEAGSSFVPAHFRQRVVQIGALVGSRCQREGMRKYAIPARTDQYSGQTFYQTDAIYHCCGALPLLVEFPCGYQNVPDNPDEILDIGMLALEEVVAFGAAYRFRPPDPKWK